MIQDIFPKKLNNQFRINELPQPDDIVLVFKGAELLIKNTENEELVFPSAGDYGESDYTYLFSVDNEKYFLTAGDREIAGCSFVDFKGIRQVGKWPMDRMFAAYTGKHLMDWYRDNRYCGRCGKEMSHSLKERAMTCPECGYTSYPRIMPAVIVAILDKEQEKIVLTKYRAGYQHYALVAGFTEIGETVEETVAREVMEETGLRVKNIRYYKSQPWGIANDILLGFYCEVDGSREIYMDDNELKFAKWLGRDEVILQPDSFSLTNEMMKRFKEGLE